MENLNLMTNEELKERKEKLFEEFEKQKEIIAKAYGIMISLQNENEEVNKIISKREGSI